MYIVSLYMALVIFGLGMIYKVSTWFRYKADLVGNEITTVNRFAAAIKGVFLTFFSAKSLTLLRVFVFDVLLQARVLKVDSLRWLMHMLIFWGTMLLIFMHAMENVISDSLFSDYQSTVNPFMFMRDLFGLMVILGILIAVYRRHILKVPRFFTHAMDRYAIGIMAVILISGVVLEGLKITSFSAFKQMESDYAGLEDPEEFRALESYWVREYGLVSPNVKGPFGEAILTLGKEIDDENCVECHSRPQWAFLGYGTAKLIRPIAARLDQADILTFFWYVHFLACFAALAYLPFSKMFHIFSSPISLLTNAVMDKSISDPINMATRQILELDACTHCGTCSLHCAVGVAYEEFSNFNILPSEKIGSIKALAMGKTLTDRQLRVIQEGFYLCTNCYRCTVVCPVGINLQEMWFNAREMLLKKGLPEPMILSPLSLYRGLIQDELTQDQYAKPIKRINQTIAGVFEMADVHNNTLTEVHMNKELKNRLGLSVQGSTFTYCFNCKTCTLSCPVVDNFDNPRDVLGLEPHHIIRATLLGLEDLIFCSRMLWMCLGCYQCQENCPQKVRVTDVLYELKNMAIRQVKEKSNLS